jgi:hypothetical protein
MKGRLKLSVMKGEIAMKTRNRQLMWHGMFLFLLGLLTGFVEQRFTNVRMGLAGHLEGVINGTSRARRHLDGGKTAVSGQGDGILDCTVWHLHELGEYDTRCRLGYGNPPADSSSRL